MSENTLTISGTVTKSEAVRYTPAGIPVRSLTLAHESEQMEAGERRRCRCQILVTIIGEQAKASFPVDLPLRLQGFLTQERNRLVVHAQHIEHIKIEHPSGG